MIWLVLVCVAVIFFYLVGKSSTPREPQPIISKEECRNESCRTHYPPGFDEPFEKSHPFKLFDTEAVMAWNPGQETVSVWCASAYSKGKRQTHVNRIFKYNYKEDYWLTGEPRGAVKEIKAEIQKTLKT